MRRERELEVFSLSFLDCICCGFGAIILLIVVSDFRRPATLEASRRHLEGQVQQLTEQLQVIRGESAVLDRELKGKRAQLEHEQRTLAHLEGDLTRTRGQYAASRQEASVTNSLESELVAAHQRLNAEMERVLKERRRRTPQNLIGGIPIDSEYVIFIVDTSSSMLDNHWGEAVQVLGEILDIYPRLKGIQILSDRARPMFPSTEGKWLTDTPALRAEMLARMKSWRVPSQSNPVEGIREAIRMYRAADRSVSLYVLGDEFTGDSIQRALDAVTEVNRPDATGRRSVRIHAVGFPEAPGFPSFTSIRFSALMRLMCEENGGTFVGMQQ
jgi:Skp family chaperone for outer membrane proteins